MGIVNKIHGIFSYILTKYSIKERNFQYIIRKYFRENGKTENIDSFAIKKDLSVKKGTGVNPSIDWMKIFSQVIAVVLPLIKSIISWVFDFISSKMW